MHLWHPPWLRPWSVEVSVEALTLRCFRVQVMNSLLLVPKINDMQLSKGMGFLRRNEKWTLKCNDEYACMHVMTKGSAPRAVPGGFQTTKPCVS